MFLPWFLCIILFVIVILLLIKIFFMRKSIDEICEELTEHMSIETNTLITVSTGDQHIRHLASQLNKQLSKLNRQRWQYLNGGQALKEAVTNISHDLRTPLTAICSYLELLEEEEISAAAHRYISIITERAELLKQLTDELFRYSIAIVSKEDTVKEKVILNEMLEESIAGFYAALKERDINPNIIMPSSKVVRYLNPYSLSRVLSNLLNNALKYSDGDLEITLSETGEIKFANTASGLGQVQAGKLFDRFYTVFSGEKSTGLGLEITRTLVRQMNGTIAAEYEHNRLCICIRFPEDKG